MPKSFREFPDRVRVFLESIAAKPVPLCELPEEYRKAVWLQFCRKRGWIDVVAWYEATPTTFHGDEAWRGISIGSPAQWLSIESMGFAGVDDALRYDPDNNPIGRNAPYVRLTEAGCDALVAHDLSEQLTPGPASDAGPVQSHTVQPVDGQSCDAGPVQSHGDALPDDARVAIDDESRKVLVDLLRHKPVLRKTVELEDSTGISRKTVGRRLNDLIDQGYVHRPNGPKAGATLTPAGETLAKGFPNSTQ